MIALLIGAFIGTILGNVVYDKFIKRVEHKHEFHITNNERNKSADELTRKIMENLKKNW